MPTQWQCIFLFSQFAIDLFFALRICAFFADVCGMEVNVCEVDFCDRLNTIESN